MCSFSLHWAKGPPRPSSTWADVRSEPPMTAGSCSAFGAVEGEVAQRRELRSSLAPGVVWLARLGAVAVDEGEQVGVDGVVVAGVQAMPGARVHGEAGCGDEFGGLAAGEFDGR